MDRGACWATKELGTTEHTHQKYIYYSYEKANSAYYTDKKLQNHSLLEANYCSCYRKLGRRHDNQILPIYLTQVSSNTNEVI